MTIVTYDEMALAALKYKSKSISTNNVHSLVVWACSENDRNTTASKARWNPWDTTEVETGDSDFNTAGVKDYDSIEEGLKAFWDTLDNGDYPHIIAALDSSSPPVDTCKLICDSLWGSKPTDQLMLQVLGDWNFYSKLPVGGSVTPDPNNPTVIIQKATPITEPRPAVVDPNVSASQLRVLAKDLDVVIAELEKNDKIIPSTLTAELHDISTDINTAADHIQEASNG